MALVPDLMGGVARVRGGSRGIGRAIALALAEAGADVAVNYREQAAQADAVAAGVRAVGRRALAVAADVSDGSAVGGLIRTVAAGLGAIDILINNAALALHRRLAPLPHADFDP